MVGNLGLSTDAAGRTGMPGFIGELSDLLGCCLQGLKRAPRLLQTDFARAQREGERLTLTLPRRDYFLREAATEGETRSFGTRNATAARDRCSLCEARPAYEERESAGGAAVTGAAKIHRAVMRRRPGLLAVNWRRGQAAGLRPGTWNSGPRSLPPSGFHPPSSRITKPTFQPVGLP